VRRGEARRGEARRGEVRRSEENPVDSVSPSDSYRILAMRKILTTFCGRWHRRRDAS